WGADWGMGPCGNGTRAPAVPATEAARCEFILAEDPLDYSLPMLFTSSAKPAGSKTRLRACPSLPPTPWGAIVFVLLVFVLVFVLVVLVFILVLFVNFLLKDAALGVG